MWKTTSQNDVLLTSQFSFQDSVIHETKTPPALFDRQLENSARAVGRVSLNLRRRFWICRMVMYQWLPSIKHREENKKRMHLFPPNFSRLCKERLHGGLSLRKMWWKSASLTPLEGPKIWPDRWKAWPHMMRRQTRSAHQLTHQTNSFFFLWAGC